MASERKAAIETASTMFAQRRPPLDRAQRIVPVPCYFAEDLIEVGRSKPFNQRQGFHSRRRVAQQKGDFYLTVWRNLHDGLQNAARIEAGADPVGQRIPACERGRQCEAAIATDELSAIARPRTLPASQVGKGHTGAELHAPRIARQ